MMANVPTEFCNYYSTGSADDERVSVSAIAVEPRQVSPFTSDVPVPVETPSGFMRLELRETEVQDQDDMQLDEAVSEDDG